MNDQLVRAITLGFPFNVNAVRKSHPSPVWVVLKLGETQFVPRGRRAPEFGGSVSTEERYSLQGHLVTDGNRQGTAAEYLDGDQ